MAAQLLFLQEFFSFIFFPLPLVSCFSHGNWVHVCADVMVAKNPYTCLYVDEDKGTLIYKWFQYLIFCFWSPPQPCSVLHSRTLTPYSSPRSLRSSSQRLLTVHCASLKAKATRLFWLLLLSLLKFRIASHRTSNQIKTFSFTTCF